MNAIIKIPIEVANDGMYVIQEDFIDVDFELIDTLLDDPVERDDIRRRFLDFIEKNKATLFQPIDDSCTSITSYTNRSSLVDSDAVSDASSITGLNADSDADSDASSITGLNADSELGESVISMSEKDSLSDYESIENFQSDSDSETEFDDESEIQSIFSKSESSLGKTAINALKIFIKPEEIRIISSNSGRKTLKNRAHSNRYTAKKRLTW
jgi:hypothetical protein